MNKPIWKSFVWHEDQCYFVSTIERRYETCEGETTGLETIVWEFDYPKYERGRIVRQGGGPDDHQSICREIIAKGI